MSENAAGMLQKKDVCLGEVLLHPRSAHNVLVDVGVHYVLGLEDVADALPLPLPLAQ